MRGAQDVKERLSIVDVLSPYLKLEKSGINFKARCPFHNEKTPSFYVSPSRQSYYCFGCGVKGDIFTFVEEVEGVDFKEALKILAEKAGVEISYERGETRSEKDRIFEVLERAAQFYIDKLEADPAALSYLKERGLNQSSIKDWRLGRAPDDWRELYGHLLSLGFNKQEMQKAGLIKLGDESKEPYDTFRGRIIFPIFDIQSRVIAFSGRALGDVEPKYLNSPDGILFNKSEVLYGLDKAKEAVRKKNYSVLVEGQMDLVLSHQCGVKNTVAASGTAFTELHFLRLKKLSERIILAFDGDEAGEKAAFKSANLGLFLGMEVKIVEMPEGSDPADLAKDGEGEKWKEALLKSSHAIEFFLGRVLEKEKDPRKAGKLILKNILPFIALLQSSIERAHFVSVISARSGIKEELIWEDLRKMPIKSIKKASIEESRGNESEIIRKTTREKIEERLSEVNLWLADITEDGDEKDALLGEKKELESNLAYETLKEKLAERNKELALAQGKKDEKELMRLTIELRDMHRELAALDERRNKV